MAVWADVQVRALISAAPVDNPSYDLTLHGEANGLLPFGFNIQSTFVPREGAYSGLAKQDNIKRKTGTLSSPLSVLLNATTKALLGKQEQILYLEVKTFADDATTLLTTETAAIEIAEAMRVDASNAPSRVSVNGPVVAYALA